jgi:hypothetical protein
MKKKKEKKDKERSKLPLDIIVTPVYNEMPFEMQVKCFIQDSLMQFESDKHGACVVRMCEEGRSQCPVQCQCHKLRTYA